MQDILGPHPNSHVIYPMPGRHHVPEKFWRPSNAKFRLAYVGSVENFYGRMLCSLIEKIEATNDLEIIVVGPNADWPKPLVERARANGTYLGFKPPEEAAQVLATADALLSVMSFEKEHELFMRTSFTTKFLDYVAFGKPVILWGPEYCTPVRVAREHGGAAVVTTDDPGAVVSLCREIAADTALNQKLSKKRCSCIRHCLIPTDCRQSSFLRSRNLSTRIHVDDRVVFCFPFDGRDKGLDRFFCRFQTREVRVENWFCTATSSQLREFDARLCLGSSFRFA